MRQINDNVVMTSRDAMTIYADSYIIFKYLNYIETDPDNSTGIVQGITSDYEEAAAAIKCDEAISFLHGYSVGGLEISGVYCD